MMIYRAYRPFGIRPCNGSVVEAVFIVEILVFSLSVLTLSAIDSSDFGFPARPWSVPYGVLLFGAPVWALPYTISRTPRGRINPTLWQYTGSFFVRWSIVTAIHFQLCLFITFARGLFAHFLLGP